MNVPEPDDVARGTANRIKQLLVEHDMSQQDASWALHVPTSQLSRWINGRNSISARYVIAICEHFNVSADWLLGLSDNPHPASRADGTSSDDRRGDAGDAVAPPPP